MVYDVPRNFVGDTHWSGHGAGGSGDSSGDIVEEGDELKLDSGILVEVAEAVGTTETDLTGLIRRRTVTREARSNDMDMSGKGLLYSDSVAGATDQYSHRHIRTRPQEHLQIQAQRKHKSLNSLLGAPKGPHGRAVLPKQSPYDVRNDCREYGGNVREAKRQRVDGQASKENVYPHRSHPVLPSSPLAGRGEGNRQRVGVQNMRLSKGKEDTPINLCSENVLSSPPYSVPNSHSPTHGTTKNGPEMLQRSSSPCLTSPAKKNNGAPASEKTDEVTRIRNEERRKLQPQTLRIGTAKPRKMLLTESLSCEKGERLSNKPEKIIEPALENSRNGWKGRRLDQFGPVNNNNTTAGEYISNIPNELSKQQGAQPLQETNRRSPPFKPCTAHERNNFIKKTRSNDPDRTITLPQSPAPVPPIISNEVNKANNNAAKSTNTEKRHASAQIKHPTLSPNKKSTNTILSTSSTTRPRQTEDDTSKHATLNSNMPPSTTSTNLDPTTTTKTRISPTKKHVSALHRPFKRVRSVPSNTNVNTNDNNNDNESSHDNSLVNNRCIGKTNTKTNTTGHNDYNDNENENYSSPDTTGSYYYYRDGHENVLSSSPAAFLAEAYPAETSPQLSIKAAVTTVTTPTQTSMPMPMPMPVAEDTGPWSVEALDLFDWRPPDWGERMERQMQMQMQM